METREPNLIPPKEGENKFIMNPEDIKEMEGFNEMVKSGFIRSRIEPYIRETPKIHRNELCPCDSGKKYKKCCLFKK